MFKTYNDLLKSDLLRGGPAYGTPKIKPWYEYLYLATFETRNKIKIGVTSSIRNRDDQLRKQGIEMKYVWSMPTNTEIESKVKQLLFLYTNRRSDESGKTEIFNNISYYAMIQLVRLATIYVYLEKGYIEEMSKEAVEARKILDGALNSLRINTIIYGQKEYTAIPIKNGDFIPGDEVMVTYPDGEQYEGTYHARIIKEQSKGNKKGYFVEWLEKEPKVWTNTTIPAEWINKDTDVPRTLDILYLFDKLKLPFYDFQPIRRSVRLGTRLKF
jgi:hypothetical protein